MTYEGLANDLSLYMLRTDQPFVAKIPDLIQQGIIRVYNNARDLGFEIIYIANNFPAGRQLISKPGNWRETISITMIDALNNITLLLPRSLEFCRTYWTSNNLNVQEKPKYYADFLYNLNNNDLANSYGQNSWFLSPTPNNTYSFQIIYLGIPLFNADNPVNFLTQRYPNLLLYSCLIEACLFLDDEEKRNKYQSMFDQELETINRMNTDRSADRTVIRANN